MADEYSVKVKIQPVLASNYKQQIESQIQSIKSTLTLKSIKIQNFDATNAIQALKTQIQSELKNLGITIDLNLKNGSGGGTPAIKQQSAEYQAATARLNSYATSYKSLLKTLSSGGANMNTGSLKKLIDAYEQIISLRGRIAKGDQTALSGILSGNNRHVKNYESVTQQLNQYAQAQKAFAKMQSSMTGMQNKAGAASVPQLTDYVSKLNAVKLKLDEIKSASPTTDLSPLLTQLDQLQTAAKTSEEAVKKVFSGTTFDTTAMQAQIKKIESLLSSESVSKDSARKLNGYKSTLEAGKQDKYIDSSRFKQIAAAIRQIEKQAGTSTSAVGTLGKALKSTFSMAQVATAVATAAFSAFTQACRQIVTNITEIDSAMAQLKIVTGGSASEMATFFNSAAESAKQYGASITDVLSSIETFARLGYNLSDSLQLSDMATVLSNVADTTVSESTTGLTSIIKGFGLEASDAEKVADELVDVGQKYAISASELMVAFENGGSSMAAAGNTLEQTMAIFAAGNAAVQNASTVGNAMKTVAARTRKDASALEQLEDDFDTSATAFSKYRDEIKQLSGVDIMISDDEYKSTYDILTGIAEVWDQISDVNQSKLLEDLAGTRNTNVVLSIIQNLQDLTGAYETATNAEGVAASANEIYMDTIEGKLGTLKASFQEFSQDVLNSDLVKAGVDILTQLLNVLDKIVSTLGGLGTVTGSLALVKNFGNIKDLISKVTGLSDAASAAAGAAGKAGKAATSFNAVSTGIMLGVTAISTAYNLYQENQKKIEQANNALIESGASAASSMSDLVQQVGEFNNLAADNTIDTNELETAQTIQESIVGLVGDQGNSIDLVNGKLDEQIEKLYEILRLNAQSNASDISQAETAAAQNLLKFGSDYVGSAGTANLFNTEGQIADLALTSFLSGRNYEGMSVTDNGLFATDHDSIEGILSYYNSLQSAINDITQEYDAQSDTLLNSTLYANMRSSLSSLKQYVDDYITSVANGELNSFVQQIQSGDISSFDEYKTNLNEILNDSDLSESGKELITQYLANLFPQYAEALENSASVYSAEGLASSKMRVLSGTNDLNASVYSNAKRLASQGALTTDSVDKLRKWSTELDNVLNEYSISSKSYAEYLNKVYSTPTMKALSSLLSSGGSSTVTQLQSLANGNVDVLNRNIVSGSKMRQAGWSGYSDNSYATFNSSWKAIKDIDGNQAIIQVTPILPNGTVMSQSELNNYIDNALSGAEDILEADRLGVVINVDTDVADADGNLTDAAIQRANAFGQQLQQLSDELTSQLDINWILKQNNAKDLVSNLQDSLSNLLSSDDFADSKTELQALAKTAGGITADKIEQLASSSTELKAILDADGISAEFLANVLQNELTSGNGMEMLTEKAIMFGQALNDSKKELQEVDSVISKYNSDTETEYNDDFQSFAQMYSDAIADIEDGQINSKKVQAAAVALLGNNYLSSINYDTEATVQAIQKLESVFGDADSNGLGLYDTLVSLADAEGNLIDADTGDILGNISADGWQIPADNYNKIAEAAGMSESAMLAALQAWEMYSAINWYTPDEVLKTLESYDYAVQTAQGTVVNWASTQSYLADTLNMSEFEIGKLKTSLEGLSDVTLLDYSSGDLTSFISQLSELDGAIAEINDGAITIDADALTGFMSEIGASKEQCQDLLDKIQQLDNTTIQINGVEIDSSSIEDLIGRYFPDAADGASDVQSAVVKANRADFNALESNTNDVASAFGNAESYAKNLLTTVRTLNGQSMTISVKFTGGTTQSYTQSFAQAVANARAAAKKVSTPTPSLSRAFASGTSNADPGISLVNEFGPELIKSGDTAYVAGNGQPTMVRLRRGDIVYTAEQTRSILGGSGKVSFPAFASGSDPRAVYKQSKTYQEKKTSSSSSSSSGSSSSSDSDDDYEEELDWIEILLDRIERTIDHLDTIASSTYQTYEKRSGALSDQMSWVAYEIETQNKAYQAYMDRANSVSLDESWKQKVRDGTIDFSIITDENLNDKIEEFQEFYEKALDCQDALFDLSETLSSLYQDAFDNVVSEFDNILDGIEHTSNMVEKYITKAETAGYVTSEQYYKKLIEVENSNIASMEKKRTAMLQAANKAVDTGAVAVYSQAWYDMQKDIDEVTESLLEARTSLIEYENKIRELSWDKFDYIEEEISDIVDQAEWLIDLMDGFDLFDDSGNITNEGLATLGLYVQNLKVYESQVQDYADEISRLNEQIANDPSNKDLLDRRDELAESHRDAISAIKDEKEAIKNLVETGINAELSALQDLIDKYTDSLDSAKDLYTYQKNIAQQTETITSLKKQISAYSGDTSEETQATVQKLKDSLKDAEENLQETQYDQYISDTKSLLSDLYDEYEQALNKRLDNIDALIAECTAQVQQNADVISSTIQGLVGGTGYTLSDSLQTIWTSTDGLEAINKIVSVTTNVTTAVNNVKASVDAIYAASQAEAEQALRKAEEQAKSTQATGTPGVTPGSISTPAATTSTTSSSSSSSSSSSAGDFFIYKKDSYPKSKLSINTSIVDRLKYRDFDSSFSARTGYYSAMGLGSGYTGSASQNTRMISWMKANGYASGSNSIPYDQLAWTQENGGEAIVRKSDGALLTPLGRGDSVFSADATKNLWAMANDPTDFISAHTVSMAPICDVVGGGSIENNIDLEITLPNVSNYSDFMNSARSDPKFEKLIQAMTVDRMAGRSSVAKNNIRW